MVIVFALGYAAIAFEHNLKIDKAAAALATGVICWAIYALGSHGGHGAHSPEASLLHHLGEISNILFFLLGAMTIVETVDAHEGFAVITDRINTNKARVLLWIICWLTFFFSAILDNLTTSIVMISLLKKLIDDKQLRWLFAGMVVIAANSGGAFSPIGDVTTTMLWIGGQVSTISIITNVFSPALVSLLVPLIIMTYQMKGTVTAPVDNDNGDDHPVTRREQSIVFTAGVLGLLFVPVFKTVTHLPPFMGMMLSLGVMWLVVDIMHRNKPANVRHDIGVLGVLRKIDTPSVLFFLGILLAVASLQESGQLTQVADALKVAFGIEETTGIYLIGSIIGVLSAIVDNVPLVAASMGMYPINEAGFFALDGLFWQFLAYTAGTGGSILIIGSAAGVAVMGLERIPFGWYLKRISLLALVGYLAGVGAYMLQVMLVG